MSLGRLLAWLPRPLARHLLPFLRYLNLMRALELRLLAPWVRQVAGWYVLDVGCGHGLYSLDLARRGAVLVGCDLDSPALTDARRTAHHLGVDGRALFLAADGMALPLAEGQFDLVVCNCVLEHIADDGAALAGMARALRPGGVLFLTVDGVEHGLALGFLERLPSGLKRRLLAPQVVTAPSVTAGLDARLDDLYAIRRRYCRDDLADRLSSLGFTLLDSRPYLTGVGAAQFEAFHALRGLEPERGLGRLLYMLSSLLLYPLAARSDDRKQGQGRGLAIVARREGGTG